MNTCTKKGLASKYPWIWLFIFEWNLVLPCCGGAENQIDLAAFLQMHHEYYNCIKTGWIEMEYEEENYTPPEKRLVQQRNKIQENYELTKQTLLNNPAVPPQQKDEFLREIERRYKLSMDSLSLPEPKKTLFRKYIFDLSRYTYRLDEVPVDDNSSEAKPRIIVTSNGSQIRYRTDIDQAAIDHYKDKVASDLPAYLGIVEPAKLKSMPEKIRTYSDRIENANVIVFEYATAEKTYILRIYADPAIGYRYRKVEWLENNSVIREIIAKDFSMFDGILFPAFHEDIIYDKTGDRVLRKTIRIKKASFNQPIDPKEFHIRFTPDTVITDLKLQLRFKPFVDEEDLSFEAEEIIKKAIELRAQEQIEPFLSSSDSVNLTEPYTVKSGDQRSFRENEKDRKQTLPVKNSVLRIRPCLVLVMLSVFVILAVIGTVLILSKRHS